MAYEPSNEQRQAARERLAARQARHAQNSQASGSSNNSASKLASNLRSGAESFSSRFSKKPTVEDDFIAGSFDEDFGIAHQDQDLEEATYTSRDANQYQKPAKPAQVDPYADIPRNYNQRPAGVRPKTAGYRPVQIQGQNDIMRPSRGNTSVNIPLITQDRVGSSQLSFHGGRNWKPIIMVIIAIILLIFIVFNITNCVKGCSDSSQKDASTNTAQTETKSSEPSEGDINRQNIDQAALAGLIGEDLANALVQTAQTNDDAAWIAAHYADYAQYEERWQIKLLTLAAKEVESIPYVRYYMDNYPAKSANGTCDAVSTGTVPNLYQWDTRWAWYPYSQSSIGMSGCGPTAVAMAYQGVTGKNDKSPYDIALDAINNGFVDGGTSTSFYSWEADNLGINCYSIDVSSSDLREALSDGGVVICNVGPGDFTQVGHFIVLVAVDDSGMVTVNDPYSAVNSSKKWDINTVINQTQAMWVYTA